MIEIFGKIKGNVLSIMICGEKDNNVSVDGGENLGGISYWKWKRVIGDRGEKLWRVFL